MTVLEDLQNILRPGHTLTIKPVSEYTKERNKQFENVKSVYVIHIDAIDSTAGKEFVENDNFSLRSIMPSKLLDFYYKEINTLLETKTNGKMYITCSTECGTEIDFEIVYNRNRVLQKV